MSLARLSAFALRNGNRNLGSRQFSLASFLSLSPEVASSLQKGLPIIALESAIITHGMPYPQNLRTAREVESIIRNNGAVPATIALIRGKIQIGLDAIQLQMLAEDKTALKAAGRDLPYIINQGVNGGTTVSATIKIAHQLGIKFLVTGGIGGVHHGAETSFDISSDLTELGKTPICVICAGIKSILDIGKSLEFLETQGVLVATLSDTDEFPAFFTDKSGLKSPVTVSSVNEAVGLVSTWQELNVQSGLVLAVPIPEEHLAEGVTTQRAITSAIQEAKEKNLSGKDVTPFILTRVRQLTDDGSLKANVHLIRNNAKVGSEIAVRMWELHKKHLSSAKGQIAFKSSKFPEHQVQQIEKGHNRPVVIGGSNVDFVCQVVQDKFEMNGCTHVGKIRQTFGGVGRNLAEGLARLGHDPIFLSAIGNDNLADQLIASCPKLDMSKIRRVDNYSTSTYAVTLDKIGECLFGVGDMDIHNQITIPYVSQSRELLQNAPLAIVDGNVPQETLDYILDICDEYSVPVWYEPTDVNRARKPFNSDRWQTLSFISPNFHELCNMYSAIVGETEKKWPPKPADCNVEYIIEESLEICSHLIGKIPFIIVTLGPHGALLVQSGRNFKKVWPILMDPSWNKPNFCATYFPSLPPNQPIVSVSGAGDSLTAAVISGILRKYSPHQCLNAGIAAATLSLSSHFTISPNLSTEFIFEHPSFNATNWKQIDTNNGNIRGSEWKEGTPSHAVYGPNQRDEL